jgi:hypothetical protein
VDLGEIGGEPADRREILGDDAIVDLTGDDAAGVELEREDLGVLVRARRRGEIVRLAGQLERGALVGVTLVAGRSAPDCGDAPHQASTRGRGIQHPTHGSRVP